MRFNASVLTFLTLWMELAGGKTHKAGGTLLVQQVPRKFAYHITNKQNHC